MSDKKLKVGDILAVDSRELKRVMLTNKFDFIISNFKEIKTNSCILLLKYLGDGKCVEYFTDDFIQIFERYKDEPTIYAKVNSYPFKCDTINYYKKWQELHNLNLKCPIGFYPNAIIENVAYNIAFNGLDEKKTVDILNSLKEQAINAYQEEFELAITSAHQDALAENMIRNFKKRTLKK